MKRRESKEKKETTRRPRSRVRSPGSAENTQVLQQRIAARAYQLYQERGARQGDPLRDWLEAERQILEQENPRA